MKEQERRTEHRAQSTKYSKDHNTKTCLTYIGLFEGDSRGSFPQGIDCCYINFVGDAGEDLWKAYVAAVFVDRIFHHFQ